MSEHERKRTELMLMMDGKLLTVNFLLATLRAQAIKDLGVDEDEHVAQEVRAYMVKVAAAGLKELLTDGLMLDWNAIKDFSESVVAEVNK